MFKCHSSLLHLCASTFTTLVYTTANLLLWLQIIVVVCLERGFGFNKKRKGKKWKNKKHKASKFKLSKKKKS